MTIYGTEALVAVLNAAIAAELGKKITCLDTPSAIALTQRLNRVRHKDRESTKQIFPYGDPRYGRSVWDSIQIRRKETAVILKKVEPLQVEDL